MIIVLAVVESSQQNIDRLKSAIEVMEQKSRAEDGCIDYTFSVELNRPGVVRISERWESLEALTAHFRQPHMADFRAAMAAHPPTSVTAHFYEASEIQPSLT